MATLAARFANDLDGMTDLPSLPPVLGQLLGTVDRADVGLAEVAEVISSDPGLAAQLLRVANSAAYGARVPAATVRDSLLRLGLREVRRLAVVLSLYGSFSKPGGGFDHDLFWTHSLGVAHAAARVARGVGGNPAEGLEPEAVFLAALLHDLGLLVLASHYPREYASVRSLVASSGMPWSGAEMELLQTDHGEIGAILVAHWHLPEAAVAALRWHHRSADAPPEWKRLVHTIQLAESVCTEAGVADLAEGNEGAIEAGVGTELGLDEADVTALVEETRTQAMRATTAVAH